MDEEIGSETGIEAEGVEPEKTFEYRIVVAIAFIAYAVILIAGF